MTDAALPAPIPCKLCSTPAPFFDRCDLHKNAKLHRGYFDAPLPDTGILLDYHACPSCGFVFTGFMDKWGPAEFATYIYNQDYPRVDGSYNGYRAGAAANIFYLAFFEHLANLDFLDYGGGLGIQAVLLKAFGAKRSLTYDPFAANITRPEGTFNLVSCLEVMEHAVDPKKIVADLVSFMNPDSGLIFVTTECTPPDIATQRTNWWYVTPRVGHISFYTRPIIDTLFAAHGLKVTHIENHTHIAYRTWPVWASQFMPAQYLPT
jgi:2-polyprenyl-6-hydroxyphenyl methylase/3-demethylubiquinone-9 3-methyltransferase